MSTLVSFNGSGYTIPGTGENTWGTNVSSYLIAIASGCLQKSGGAFTLTAEVDFGATYSVKGLYFKTRSTNPASTGQFRLANTDTISWRNAANSADLALSVNSSNLLTYAGNPIASSTALTANYAMITNASGTPVSSIGVNNQVLSTQAGVVAWNTPNPNNNFLYANPDAEINATTGWAAYANAVAAATPETGTGGTPAAGFSWTASATTPLNGTYSFLWTKPASNIQGTGVSYDFTPQPGYAQLGQEWYIRFNYKLASGSQTWGRLSDIRVYLYDVTNAVLVTPRQVQLADPSDNSGGVFVASFRTNQSSSYRLILHSATTSTSAATVQFDQFYVGPNYNQSRISYVECTGISSQTWNASTTYNIPWTTELYDLGNQFANSTSTFTAKASRSYTCSGQFNLAVASGLLIGYVVVQVTRSGSTSAERVFNEVLYASGGGLNGYYTIPFNFTTWLDIGDSFQIQYETTSFAISTTAGSSSGEAFLSITSLY